MMHASSKVQNSFFVEFAITFSYIQCGWLSSRSESTVFFFVRDVDSRPFLLGSLRFGFPVCLSVRLRCAFVHSIRLAGLFVFCFVGYLIQVQSPKMACRLWFPRPSFLRHPCPIQVVAVAIPTELFDHIVFSQQLLRLQTITSPLTQQPHPPPSPLRHPPPQTP